MKYFISWYPDPPDPRYWEWFKIDGLMISCASLKGHILCKALNLGLHRFTGFNGPIFLDSGAFQFNTKETRKSQIEILEIQRWLEPDLISHLDKPYIAPDRIPEDRKWRMLEETIENAKVAKKWENRNDIQVIYVIQGWNRQALEICAKKMFALRCDYYGIGSLYRQPPSEISKRVRVVRKIIGKKPKLHLFGTNPMKIVEDTECRKILSGINSSDSSSPMRAGIVKEIFDPEARERKHINYAHKISKTCGCPVCRKFPYEIGLGGLKGRQRRYNRLRAIHNAYWLTEIAHSFK